RNSRPSRSMTNVNTSPPLPHPKQCQLSRSGLTMNDGVFSAWNGHRPLYADPARLRATVSPTSSTTGSLDLMSATMPDEVMAMAGPASDSLLSRGSSRGGSQFYHTVKSIRTPLCVSSWTDAACPQIGPEPIPPGLLTALHSP